MWLKLGEVDPVPGDVSGSKLGNRRLVTLHQTNMLLLHLGVPHLAEKSR